MHELPSSEELIRLIHAAPGQIVLAVTGGGSSAISQLLTVPGGSRTVLEAMVPYSAQSLVDFLGAQPENFCSARTARAMAMAAFQRARRLQAGEVAAPSPQPSPVKGEGVQAAIGVGCTASLASDRPKRGPHRIHVALQTAELTATHSLELVKDRRTRSEEEDVSARIVLNAIAEAFGLEERIDVPLLAGERIETVRTTPHPSWRELLLGRTSAVSSVTEKPRAVFPGAFNPLHEGHLRMAEIAAGRLGAPVHFELSIENVDKPPLDYTEMAQRAAQFTEKSLPLWITRAPTFVEKSRLFPDATFIVGADTLARIDQPRFYDNDPAAAENAIKQIADRGCRFLVFGRVVDGQFESLADLKLSVALRKLCEEVPPAEFRQDISSTELRRTTSDD